MKKYLLILFAFSACNPDVKTSDIVSDKANKEFISKIVLDEDYFIGDLKNLRPLDTEIKEVLFSSKYLDTTDIKIFSEWEIQDKKVFRLISQGKPALSYHLVILDEQLNILTNRYIGSNNKNIHPISVECIFNSRDSLSIATSKMQLKEDANGIQLYTNSGIATVYYRIDHAGKLVEFDREEVNFGN